MELLDGVSRSNRSSRWRWRVRTLRSSARSRPSCKAPSQALGQAVLLTALVHNRTVVPGVVTLWNVPSKLVLPWPVLHASSAALLESGDIEPVALPLMAAEATRPGRWRVSAVF